MGADLPGRPSTGLWTNTKTNGPLFRVFGAAAPLCADTLLYDLPGENFAGTSPSRTFPDLAQIVAGNTNSKTGTRSGAGRRPRERRADPVDCFSEFLPTSDWTDLASPCVMLLPALLRGTSSPPTAAADHAGGLSLRDVALTVRPTAGPFLSPRERQRGPPPARRP